MKTVKLRLLNPDEKPEVEVHGDLFEGNTPDPNGTTYLCGNDDCGKAILDGYAPDFMSMRGADLVCQHCGSHNYLDTDAT